MSGPCITGSGNSAESLDSTSEPKSFFRTERSVMSLNYSGIFSELESSSEASDLLSIDSLFYLSWGSAVFENRVFIASCSVPRSVPVPRIYCFCILIIKS
jgi:hypothetical protein